MNIADFIVAGGGCALIVLSFGYLTIRDGRPGKPISFVLYLITGFDVLCVLCEARGMYSRYPQLIYLNQPFELFFGPLTFWYLMTRIRGKVFFDRLTAFLFLPGIFGVMWFVPFSLQPPAVKLASIGFAHTAQPAKTVYLLIMYSAIPFLSLCLIITMINAYIALGKKSFAHHMRMRVLIAHGAIWLIIIVSGYFFNLFSHRLMIDVTLVEIEAYLVVLYYLDMRHADFFDMIAQEVRISRYRRSHINGLDTGSVIIRLRELMEYDRLFLDDRLSLRSMSETLEISPHQLSEILNSGLNMNFKTFVNSYRIEEAKKKLTAEKNSNILNLAFECGFNSKTVFNTTFFKTVGKTPTEYRSENTAKRT